MNRSKKQFTVGLVEPHTMIARGLKEMIGEIKDFEVVATVTGNCLYFVERIIAARPDILIINPAILDYKKRNKIEELTHLTGSGLVVALMTHYMEPDMVKPYHAVIDVSDSEERISSKLKKLVEIKKTEPETSELTQREKDVLACVAKGMMNKEIADRYHLSIHTVITHRKNITKKTGIKSVSGLTVFAILNNLIDIQDIE